MAIGLLVSWGLLALVYAIVPRAISAGIKRRLTLGQAWKLSVAAQMSGAVLINFGIVLYALGEISLLFLLAIFVAHFLLSWLYLLAGPFCLPEARDEVKSNPFKPERQRAKARKTNNPFASGEEGE